ncbi:type II secretion system protein [Pseudoalteromonas sp. GB56]
MSKSKSNGFTLIELLVAITIISSVIAISTVVYSNYLLNDRRFAESSELYSDLLEASDSIREQVKAFREESGSVKINETSCDWSTKEKTTETQTTFDFVTGQLSSGGTKFTLVQLIISCQNGNKIAPEFNMDVLIVDAPSSGFMG